MSAPPTPDSPAGNLIQLLLGTLQNPGEENRGADALKELDAPSLAALLEKLSRLWKISDQVTRFDELDSLLVTVTEAACQALGAERASIFLHDPEEDVLILHTSREHKGPWHRIPRDKGIAGAVFADGKSRIIPDAYADPLFNPEFDRQSGFRTRNMLCVPIRSRQGTTIGVMQLLNRIGGPTAGFGEEDRTVAQWVGRQAAAALEAARLVESIGKERRIQGQMLEMAAILSQELQLEKILLQAVEMTNTILEADRSTLFVHDPKSDELVSLVSLKTGTRELRVPRNQGIAWWTFTHNDVVNLRDAYDDPRFFKEMDQKTGYRTRSLLSMPLVTHKRGVMGVVQVINKRDGVFTPLDQKRLAAFCAHIAGALENARLFRELEEITQYNENILESMSNGMVTLDPQHRVVKCNRALMFLWRTTAEAVLGRTLEEICGPENAWVAKALKRSIEGNSVESVMDSPYRLQNGESTWINLTALPLTGVDQEAMGSLLILEDISTEKRIKSTMGRYLSREVMETLIDSPDGLKLGGETREVTFLVSDLRGFTAITTQRSPEEVVDLLNRYLECMVEVITNHAGTIDEFQGDGILAFFGAPIAYPDDLKRAVSCAIDMQVAMLEFNRQQKRANLPELSMSVAVHTGLAIVGNIGSEVRTKYGAVGETINTAYRIESCSTPGQVLISDKVRRKLGGELRLRDSFERTLKGVKEPLLIHEVAGLGHHVVPVVQQRLARIPIQPLTREVPFLCQPLHGKTVVPVTIGGSLTHWSKQGVWIRLTRGIRLDSDLRLIFQVPQAETWPNAYGRVTSEESRSGQRFVFGLEFTSLDERISQFLAGLVEGEGGSQQG